MSLVDDLLEPPDNHRKATVTPIETAPFLVDRIIKAARDEEANLLARTVEMVAKLNGEVAALRREVKQLKLQLKAGSTVLIKGKETPTSSVCLPEDIPKPTNDCTVCEGQFHIFTPTGAVPCECKARYERAKFDYDVAVAAAVKRKQKLLGIKSTKEYKK